MLNSADANFIQKLKSRLPGGVLADVKPSYLEEPRGRYNGLGGCLALPRSVEEVAEIVRTCAKARVGIVPYGGGTGLVGGQVMPDGPAPVILSLERMNRVREVWADENVMIVEAGAILQDIQAAAADADRLFPLTLAAQGSCRIGGNLATNAGGVNVLRYGNARDLCLGLEAVLPNGEIYHGLKRLRKDNTGYDLRDLLIGSEGTLGVITAASLRLYPQHAATGAALMVVPDPAAALALLGVAQDHAGPVLSAFELISGVGLEFLTQTMPQLRLPFPDAPDWMVLIDLGGARGQKPDQMLEAIFTDAFKRGLVTDGVIAQSEAQRADFWAVRETIPEANKHVGSIASHDISLPLSVVPAFITKANGVLAKLGDMRINCFGHLGDGNLHYNAFPALGKTRDNYDDLRGEISDIVHSLVAEMDGSFSAEHGVGRMKVADLEKYSDPARLAAMRAIKTALDPVGIINPGAVLGNT